MTAGDQFDSVKQRTANADGIPPLLRVLEELHSLEPKQENGEELDELRLSVFESLARLTQDAPSEAGPIIVRCLLPLCLRTKGEWRVPHMALRYNKALSRWLDRFPTLHRFALRAQVLDALVELLDEAGPERACRLIGMLGYREDRAFSRLIDLARAGADSVRDVAIHALTAFGVPQSEHAALARLWLDRASVAPWNHDLIGAAKQLASTEILDLVLGQWLIPENLRDLDGSGRLLAYLALTVPSAVSETFPDDAELQDRVWDRLQAIEPTAPDLFFHGFLGSTQVAQPCDTPGVIRYYVSKLACEERTRDLAYIRLEECNRPRQLVGWEDTPGAEVIQAALQDAVAATAMLGSFTTADLRRKLRAWQTLLSLGRGEALAHLEDALLGERNGHAVGEVLDLAACFRLDPIPPRVCDLIAGEFGSICEDDSERMSSHVHAIALAHASGSSSALDALLAFKPNAEGGVLISLVDALADTVAALVRAGDSTAATGRLWEATACDQPEHRRAAATGALARLLRRNLLRPISADRLTALVEDESLDSYARREMLAALGHVPKEEVAPQILKALRRALASATAATGSNGEVRAVDFRPVALTSLARIGVLASDAATIREHLALRLTGGVWRCNSRPTIPVAPEVVGILYAEEPATFAPAVADLLHEGDWATIVQLAPFLRDGPRPIPEPILAAIVERVRRTGPEWGEPDLVRLLGELAPERIASESWSGMFAWPPQVREALADALAYSRDDVNRRIDLLLDLMGDGQYGVRRAAFRAMGRIDQNRLHSVCTGWALLTEANVEPPKRPYAIDMRRRAAEAAAWLEPIPSNGPIANLASDQEPDVRATFARCRQERQERRWAKSYLARVLTVHDNASLLTAWKYGRALERTGDDETLQHLRERRRQDLPPGVRYWLGRLIKKLRARWDKATREWPEPWFARRGRLARVEALIGDDEAKANRVLCWLWQVPPTDLVDRGVWGGWCPDVALLYGMQTLRVPGCYPATILVQTTSWVNWGGKGPTYFVGSGPYPEPMNNSQ